MGAQPLDQLDCRRPGARTRSSDEHAAEKTGIEGHPFGENRALVAGEYLHVWPAADTGARDDVRAAVATSIARRHRQAAVEVIGIGKKARQFMAIDAAKCPNMRTAAGPGRGDDIGAAIAIEVARRDRHAAAEARIECEEA